MPTANPIGAGKGFISDNELMFLYGGVGIGDYVSLTAGMTTVPLVSLSSQLMTTQLKVSVAEEGAFNLAFGGSASWFTSQDFFAHMFVSATILYDTTWWITAMGFYKLSGPDLVDVQVGKLGSLSFPYLSPMGFAIGLETRPAWRNDMRFVGEFWFDNGSAFMLGIRLGNGLMEETFGVVLANGVVPVPVMGTAFRW